MKKFSLAALAATAMIALAAPASATDFSFVGTLANDDEVLFFNFDVAGPSLVTLRTYSYAGGVNAAGAVIARGGFDPILSLYNSATGARVGQNDDGDSNVPADVVTGARFDTYLQTLLGAGSYTVAVSQWANFGPDSIPNPFPGSGRTNFTDFTGNVRDGHWAFDVLNVASATQEGLGVPEPATWGLLITGFALTGAMLRRRRQVATTA